jgi:hypothetical protein
VLDCISALPQTSAQASAQLAQKLYEIEFKFPRIENMATSGIQFSRPSVMWGKWELFIKILRKLHSNSIDFKYFSKSNKDKASM